MVLPLIAFAQEPQMLFGAAVDWRHFGAVSGYSRLRG
jgi:hypothetical protein